MRQGGGEGARIRAMRSRAGVSQSALARMAGISPSYLNLIEHGRRAIGGKVLGDLARALDTDPLNLSRGAEAALVEALRQAAATLAPDGSARPELDRADAFAANFPGWAGAVARQSERIAALERSVAGLGERLNHDPLLSASVHDVLSAVTAIRATSAILVEDAGIEAEWRLRFHRNLFEDSRRLAESARALARRLEGNDGSDRSDMTPQDEMERWLAARDYHIAALETEGVTDEAVEAETADIGAGPMRRLLLDHLRLYRDDARALSRDRMAEAAETSGTNPFAIAGETGQDPARVMRRLIALPDLMPERPGLIQCDGAGAITLRRPLRGFGLPRFGTGCPLWPLYEVLWSRRPLSLRLKQADRAARPVMAHAVARIDHPRGPDGPARVAATMLIVPDDGGERAEARPVGQACRICPRTDCLARSEPSILPAAPI